MYKKIYIDIYLFRINPLRCTRFQEGSRQKQQTDMNQITESKAGQPTYRLFSKVHEVIQSFQCDGSV